MSHLATVYCSEHYTVFLDNNKCLYTLGINNCGECGSTNPKYASMVPIPILILKNIVSVSCGKGFTICCNGDGELFGFGQNSNLQLGTGDLSSRDFPVKITTPNFEPIYKVFCGYDFTFCIDYNNDLWTFGDNHNHQLGRNELKQYTQHINIVTEVSNIEYVSCGNGIAICMDSSNNYYVFGKNNYTGKKISSSILDITNYLPNDNIHSFSCGYYHATFLLNDGSVYINIDYNHLNYNNITKTFGECKIDKISNIRAISSGNYNTYCIDNDYNLWNIDLLDLSFEVNEENKPKIKKYKSISNIYHIAYSSNHTFVRDIEGKVYFIGRNTYNHLGDVIIDLKEKRNIKKKSNYKNPLELTKQFSDIFGIIKLTTAKSARK